MDRLGKRLRHLRRLIHMSIEQVSQRSGVASKGHISQAERGLALPQLTALQQIAIAFGVELIDLINFPEQGPRHELIELTRFLSTEELGELIRHTKNYLAQRSEQALPAAARPAPAYLLPPDTQVVDGYVVTSREEEPSYEGAVPEEKKSPQGPRRKRRGAKAGKPRKRPTRGKE